MKNYKLKITVTKEILRKSMRCGEQTNIPESCAIALATRDIFPIAGVGCEHIIPFYREDHSVRIPLPKAAIDYIKEFDSRINSPLSRLDLPEITFEVEIPDEVIDKIDISKIYEGHPTLQLFKSIDN